MIGQILSVQQVYFGSSVVGDVASGATTLPVFDLLDFSVSGGTVSVGGQAVAYTAVDDGPTDALLLAAPLTTDVSDGAEVLVLEPDGTPAVLTQALVAEPGAAGEDDALLASVDLALVPFLPLGIRDEPDEFVEVESRGGTLVVTNLLNRTPSFDGSLIASGTLEAVRFGLTTSYVQGSAPDGAVVGDVWIDTANGNVLKTWDGSAWTTRQDVAISTAQTVASSKNAIFVQGTAPTATKVGDLWVDTANGNVVKTWDGSAWVAKQDTAIGTAQTAANNAQTAANTAQTAADNAQTTATSKNATFVTGTAPTATKVGDLWVDTANGNVVKTWDGSAWVARQAGSGAIAADAITATQIAAGAIGTGELAAGAVTAATIATDTITAAQIAAGAIGTGELAAGAVTADTLAANAVTAGKIDANAVTAGTIAAGAVATGSLATGAVTTDTLAADAVTAAKLAAGAVVARNLNVVATDTSGSRLELQPSGLTMYDTEGSQILSLTAVPPSYLAINATDGTTKAAINSDGVGSFTTVWAEGDIRLGGDPLVGNLNVFGSPSNTPPLGILDPVPRGPVAFDSLVSNWSWASGTSKGIRELSFIAEAGRAYRVSVASFLATPTTAAKAFGLTVRLTVPASIGAEAPTPTFDNGVGLGWVYTQGAASVLAGVPRFTRILRCNTTGDTSAGGELVAGVNKILVAAVAANTQWAWYNNSANPLQIIVEDIGLDVPIAGRNNTSVPGTADTGSGSAGTYTKTYSAAWSQTYKEDNSQNTVSGTDAYQGYYSGTNGNQKSLIGAPSAMLSAIAAAATIKKIEVYLYFYHWYNNSGGTAVLGSHSNASKPSTFSNYTDNQWQSGSWPKPGGRWVTIPSNLYSYWTSGTYKGVVVGPGASTSSLYYGKAYGTGGSYPPKFRLTYTMA